MRENRMRLAALMAALGVMSFPAAASAQGPIEQSDDLPYEEETAPVWNNSLFHTDQGADYRTDGGTGTSTDSDFHSDDNSQNATVEESLVDNASVQVAQSYDQIKDESINDYTASSDSGSTHVNYTRTQEDYSATIEVVIGGETVVDEATPTVEIPTGYQLYDALF